MDDDDGTKIDVSKRYVVGDFSRILRVIDFAN